MMTNKQRDIDDTLYKLNFLNEGINWESKKDLSMTNQIALSDEKNEKLLNNFLDYKFDTDLLFDSTDNLLDFLFKNKDAIEKHCEKNKDNFHILTKIYRSSFSITEDQDNITSKIFPDYLFLFKNFNSQNLVIEVQMDFFNKVFEKHANTLFYDFEIDAISNIDLSIYIKDEENLDLDLLI